MKKIFLAVTAFIGMQLHAQNCANYFFLQKGKTVEMTIYDKKGEAAFKQVYHITNVSSDGGTTTGAVNTEMVDKKGRTIATSASTMKCKEGALFVDMKVSMAPQPGQQVEIAKGKLEDFFIEYPVNMGVGDQLKDASLNMDIETSGIKNTTTMVVRDRKVEGKEKITTPAGSWDCFKISQKTKMTIRVMGIIPKTINVDTKEWYAPGFGVVKTESDQQRMEITAIK